MLGFQASLRIKYLAQFGRCDVATDGHEAVHAVRVAIEENQPFDLIFLDIQMPNFDGQQALPEIRKLEELNVEDFGEGGKIIMITSLSEMKNIMKAYKGQCDDYLIKPLNYIRKLYLKTKGTWF